MLAGVIWLWTRWRQLPPVTPPWRLLAGGLVAGWGVFNVVEGIVDHHILAIHHVVDGDNTGVFDFAFLAAGALMVAADARLTTPATARPVNT